MGREGAANRRHLLPVLIGLSAFGPLTTDVYLPGLPSMASAFGVSTASAQLTLTACVIGLGLGQLAIGPLSDMSGRRRPLVLCLGCFVLASVGCALAPSLGLTLVARLAQGIGGAGGIVLARAMVRDRFTGLQVGRTYSTLTATSMTGQVVAPLLGGAILLVSGWREIFVLLALVGVALLLGVLFLTEETLPPERREAEALGQTGRNLRMLLGHRSYMGFVLAGAFGFGTLFAYISASSFVYQDTFGMSAQLYSLLFAVNGIALVGMNLLNRRLLRRTPAEALLHRGLIALTAWGCVLSALLVLGAGAAIVLPVLLLNVASFAFVAPNSVALAMRGEPSRAGAAAALYGLLQFAIGALIAPLVGLGGGSAVPMGIVMAGSAAVALLCFQTLVRPAR